MPGMSFPVHVTMRDGTEHEITVEQHDIGAWERQPFGCSFSMVMQRSEVTFYRWVAWHVLRRTGEIDKRMGWATFDEEACKEVVDSQPEEEARSLPDPTTPDTSGETS